MATNDLINLMIHAVLSIFGMAARELRWSDEKQLRIAKFVSNAIIASFGATIAFFVISMSDLPLQIGYVTAGLVGWGGPQIIDKLFQKNSELSKDIDFAEDRNPSKSKKSEPTKGKKAGVKEEGTKAKKTAKTTEAGKKKTKAE